MNASVPCFRSAVFGLAVLAAACQPSAPAAGPAPRAPEALEYRSLTEGLPPIPRVDAPLAIRVIQPAQNSARPSVDSTFVYGSVATGGASLTINGTPVPVARNGAFIAYLPLPADGAWRLEATKGGERADATVSYRAPSSTPSPSTPAAAPAGSLPEGAFSSPVAGVVTGGGDTLATGSDAVYARPTPTGTYRWFFPRGTRLTLLERRRGQYRVQLDTASAWIDTTAVRTRIAGAAELAGGAMQAQVVPVADGAELRIASGFAPFLVEPGENDVTVTVYRAGAGDVRVERNDFVTGAEMTSAGASARARVTLSRGAWGYRAFYRPDGTLVVRIRQPPRIDAADPLRGMRIVIDPGHPPAGATGPTGLYEGDANLAISLRLAERLRAGGAEVVMTRTTDAPLELVPRVEQAVDTSAHLLISVHNNAFGEGQNPFRSHHTSAYYFHPFSRELAAALVAEIAPVVRIPNRGALYGNLALVRPTWMPSALTESLFMPIPEQENALRDPQFVDRLAEAHARGIAAFLRSRAGR